MDAAEVHRDEVAGLYERLTGHAVRHTGVRAGDGDGVKAVALGAVAHHAVGQLGGQLALGKAGLDERQRLLQRLFGYALGGYEPVQLVRALVRAQRLHQRPRGGEAPAEQALHLRVQSVGELVLLGAYLAAYVRAERLERGSERGLDRGEQHLHALDALALRVLYVA